MDPITLVPGAYALSLLDVASRWGVLEGALLDGLELSRDLLARPTTRVEVGAYREMVARAHRLTGEEGLALYLGAQMHASTHGFLGFALLSSATLGDALALGQRFIATRVEALSIELAVDGDRAAVAVVEQSPLGDLREFTIVSALVAIAQLAPLLTGRAVAGIAELAMPEPAYYERLAHLLPGPARFDCPHNRLVFAREALDYPLVEADAIAVQLAREQCERELASIGGTGAPARVRQLLPRAGDGFRSLEEVAHKMAVSPRTLKRSLAANGTRFSDLLDELRRTRALKLLAVPGPTLEDIAHRLGYADVAGFTRAFRRWTGNSPGAHRRQRA